MAVIPSLAVMAGLTLLYNPEAQPEGTEIDYTPMRPFAVRLQRAWKRTINRGLTPVRRIQRVWQGFRVRGNLPGKWIITDTGTRDAMRNTRYAVSYARTDYANYQHHRTGLGLIDAWARSRREGLQLTGNWRGQ